MHRILFATSNSGKFREVASLAAKLGIQVEWAKFKGVEIQHENLSEIAKHSVRQALQRFGRPVMVEDAGLFIEALKGFPGPYSSYVYKTLGVQGILKLMEGVKRREACFLSAIAYAEPGLEPKVFLGKVEGFIVPEARGSKGFGFDPIFQPKGSEKTFAEMGVEEKNRFSHRAKALSALAEWLKRGKP